MSNPTATPTAAPSRPSQRGEGAAGSSGAAAAHACRIVYFIEYTLKPVPMTLGAVSLSKARST